MCNMEDPSQPRHLLGLLLNLLLLLPLAAAVELVVEETAEMVCVPMELAALNGAGVDVPRPTASMVRPVEDRLEAPAVEEAAVMADVLMGPAAPNGVGVDVPPATAPMVRAAVVETLVDSSVRTIWMLKNRTLLLTAWQRRKRTLSNYTPHIWSR